jgi:hypothetical protein
MKKNQLRDILKWGLLISVFNIIGCASTASLYSVNMYYDADKAAIPAYLRADKTSSVVISIAEFTDKRQMDDQLVIGRVVEQDGMKNLVFPKNVTATKAVSKGIKEYLRKAGYKVSDKILQWNLKEETMPKEDFKIIIGGTIDELEISCRRGFPSNSYTANMKLTIVFADVAKGKIIYKSRVESNYSREYVLFSEETLGEQAGIALGDAIEKVFADETVAQKLKEAISN